MAGAPSISIPRPDDWRGLQSAISAIIQRFQNVEATLGTTTSTATTTANTTTSNLNSILSTLATLQADITALQNAEVSDVESFIAGEPIAAGQVVVPISANTVGVADPNDTSRIFGVLGVATGPAATSATVLVQRAGVFPVPGATSYSIGRAVYVDTGGGITQTPDYDAVAIPLGVAVTPSSIFINVANEPALLSPTYSSGFINPFENYLAVTYKALQALLNLEELIAALPYQSGADTAMQVPVLTDGGIAVRVSAGDIASLGGGGGGLTPIAAGDLLANLTGGSAVPIGHPFSDILAALPYSSGVAAGALVPVDIGGVAVTVTAEDIAALAAQGITALTGDVTASGTGSVAATIAAGAVTYAKMQNSSAGEVVLARAASTAGSYGEVALATSQLLGRGSSGDIAAIALGTNLSMSGATLNATGSGGTSISFGAYAAADTSITSATFTKIGFNTKEWDTNNWYSTALSRVTPTIACTMQIDASSTFLGGTNGNEYLLCIYKNGSLYRAGTRATNTVALRTNSMVSSLVQFNGTTDYVEIFGYCGTNNGVTDATVAGPSANWFNGAVV